MPIRCKGTAKCPRACELFIISDDPSTPVKTLDVMAYTSSVAAVAVAARTLMTVVAITPRSAPRSRSLIRRTFLRDCNELVDRTDDIVNQMRRDHDLARRLIAHPCFAWFRARASRAAAAAVPIRVPAVYARSSCQRCRARPGERGFRLRTASLFPRSKGLISRKLISMPRVLCASRDCLRRYGGPRHARDLRRRCIAWYCGDPTRDRLIFQRAIEQLSPEVKLVLKTNTKYLQWEYALEHVSFVCVPTLKASDPVLMGAVLQDYPLSSFWLSQFYPTALHSSLKLNLFLDVLAAGFSDVSRRQFEHGPHRAARHRKSDAQSRDLLDRAGQRRRGDRAPPPVPAQKVLPCAVSNPRQLGPHRAVDCRHANLLGAEQVLQPIPEPTHTPA